MIEIAREQKRRKNALIDVILLSLNETVLRPCQRRTASFDTCLYQGNMFPTVEYELHATEVEFLQRDENCGNNDIKRTHKKLNGLVKCAFEPIGIGSRGSQDAMFFSIAYITNYFFLRGAEFRG